jgi:hypothetical protein
MCCSIVPRRTIGAERASYVLSLAGKDDHSVTVQCDGSGRLQLDTSIQWLTEDTRAETVKKYNEQHCSTPQLFAQLLLSETL